MSAKKIIIAVIGGVFVGFLNGCFGAGGGILVVPLLIYIFQLPDKEAHATAIFTILPISISSAIVYIIFNDINFYNLSFSTLGFICGGVLGAFILKKINNKVLRVIFGVLIIIAGIRMLIWFCKFVDWLFWEDLWKYFCWFCLDF